MTHLQSSLSLTLPDDIRRNLLWWLDDCLLYSPDIDEFIHCVRCFLDYCKDFEWKLHLEKCILFAQSVRWCGRVISPAGIRHVPARLETLLEMDRPTSGGQLQQFLCAMQCLRSAIPQFQSLVRPLHELLESVYLNTRKRTKRAVARVSLDALGWTPELSSAFESCKRAFIDRVTLAPRNECKRMCIYTDASDMHWSGIVTQVPLSDLSLTSRESS